MNFILQMANTDAASYACYYCVYEDNDLENIVHHTLLKHDVLSLRKRSHLCHETGKHIYQSLHFKQPCNKISSKLDEGYKLIVDPEELKIRFKRESTDVEICNTDVQI